MYVNLILGAVALVVVWLYLKKLLVKDDTLTESPARLLEKELAKRREREEERNRAFERLRESAAVRMRPVVSAMEELRDALPEKARNTLSWEDSGDALLIRMREGTPEEGGGAVSLQVAWRMPEIDLRRAAALGEDMPGVYVARRSDVLKEENFATLDACMQYVAAFIVDFMD